ncbi:MAG: hypothetical protein H7331_03895, partial [Bacteroidia bacterium]|nr:hypothetical protein [Bacteroidia bacterium]
MINMYKKISVVLLVTTGLFATKANAQLATGNITIGTTAGYATLANAVDSLNLYGVTVPTTIKIPVGYIETAPVGGFRITATGTIANPIIITGLTGGAKPVITANTTNIAGTLTDAIIKIVGGDFITINNLELRENAANTVAAAATNTMTEWGIALLYASTTNASQNITLTNNTIVLSSSANYQNAFGIYANATHSSTAPSTSVPATTTLGTNSGLVIKSNTISGVNNGIVVIGTTAIADFNDGITIGGTTLADGNTITGFGFTGTFSAYANVSGSINGVLVRNSKNVVVSNNTITSSALATAGTVFGIQFPGFSVVPSGAFTQNINSNSISLKTNFIAGTLFGISMPSGNASTTSTININNNNFSNFDHATATGSGTIFFITQTGFHQFININNNTFTNISLKTTGSVTLINNNLSSPANGVKNVNGNSIVTAFNKTGAGGTVTLINDQGNSPAGTFNTMNNNSFVNINFTGSTIMAGVVNVDGATPPSGPTKTVTGNTLSLWNGGTSSITGLNISFSGSSTVSGNVVSDITGAGNITGITSGSGIETFTGNTVRFLSSTGASIVTGIANTGGITKVFNGNKIHTLEVNNAGGSVNGILLSGGTTVTVQNNVIGDLRAPIAAAATDVIRGINITSTATLANYNIYYNSIYLNAVSSGANFSTTGIFHTTNATATSAQLNLNNNVIVNKSTPMGTGVTSVLRRSSNVLTNFGTGSNNNLLYVDTTIASRAMLYDGTTLTQGLSAYKTLVTPRETSSKAENVAFVSTIGTNPTFLQINTVTPTFAESGALNIGGITTDFGGVIRQGNAGYAGTGTAPDMGAYEFNGVSNLPLCAGTPAVANTASTSTLVCSGTSFGLSLSTNYSGTAGITYQWQSSPDSITFNNIASATGATYTASQTATTFYKCVIICSNSGMSVTSAAIKVSLNSFLNCYCAATYSSGCGSGDEITKVVYKTINNVSTCSAGNYANYNTPNPTVFLGATDTMRVSFGTDGNQYSAVWIDLNQDGDFADAGEVVAASTVTPGTSGTTIYLVTIPATATVGTTKMRIRGGNDVALTNTPCGASTSSFGETEDYLITIACPTMVGPTTSNSFICTNNSATLIAAANNAGALKWFTDSIGGTLIKTGNSYTTSILNADTTLWAQESIGVSCISPRTKVKVNITQVTVALNPINVTCNGGSTGSFT